MLFQVQARTDAVAVPADGGDIYRRSSALGELYGVIEQSHAAAAVEDGDGQAAGEGVDFMTPLEFEDGLKLMEARVEARAVRHGGQIEQAAAQRPDTLVPLDRGSRGVTPSICRIIKRAGVDGGPIQKINARIVGILIRVKNVCDAEFADGDDHPVGAASAAQLVGRGVD